MQISAGLSFQLCQKLLLTAAGGQPETIILFIFSHYRHHFVSSSFLCVPCRPFPYLPTETAPCLGVPQLGGDSFSRHCQAEIQACTDSDVGNCPGFILCWCPRSSSGSHPLCLLLRELQSHAAPVPMMRTPSTNFQTSVHLFVCSLIL